jgi:hypothetical protein
VLIQEDLVVLVVVLVIAQVDQRHREERLLLDKDIMVEVEQVLMEQTIRVVEVVVPVELDLPEEIMLHQGVMALLHLLQVLL